MALADLPISDARLRSVHHDRDGVRLALTMWDGSERSLVFTGVLSCDTLGLFSPDLSHIAIVPVPERLHRAAAVWEEDLSHHRCFAVYAAAEDAVPVVSVVAVGCTLV